MTVKDFGSVSDGTGARLFVLEKEGLSLAVSDYGALLVSLKVSDKSGRPVDVVLGYEDVSGYEKDAGYYFGANVGRNANRIGGARFVMNGREYTLEKNDGENNLHSGFSPYSKRFWKLENHTDTSVMFSLESPDMDQGFPGALKLYITYELLAEDSLRIRYEALPRQDTVINMTNHSYFNLNGEGSGTVLDHRLTLYADAFTPADASSIPTGEIEDVTGTPMDFRTGKPIGQDIGADYQPLVFANGYDHNFVLKGTSGCRPALKVTGDKSGITMYMETDCPGLQLYTANFVKDARGKNGHIYQPREAVCFEPQLFPDAVNHADFPSPICRAGEKYQKEIVYHFEA